MSSGHVPSSAEIRQKLLDDITAAKKVERLAVSRRLELEGHLRYFDSATKDVIRNQQLEFPLFHKPEDIENGTEPAIQHGSPGKLGGRTVRWEVLRQACDQLPGRTFRIRDLTKFLQTHQPYFEVRPQYMTRDLARKPDLWRRVNGAPGLYECLWKPEEKGALTEHTGKK